MDESMVTWEILTRPLRPLNTSNMLLPALSRSSYDIVIRSGSRFVIGTCPRPQTGRRRREDFLQLCPCCRQNNKVVGLAQFSLLFGVNLVPRLVCRRGHVIVLREWREDSFYKKKRVGGILNYVLFTCNIYDSVTP